MAASATQFNHAPLRFAQNESVGRIQTCDRAAGARARIAAPAPSRQSAMHAIARCGRWKDANGHDRDIDRMDSEAEATRGRISRNFRIARNLKRTRPFSCYSSSLATASSVYCKTGIHQIPSLSSFPIVQSPKRRHARFGRAQFFVSLIGCMKSAYLLRATEWKHVDKSVSIAANSLTSSPNRPR